MKKPMIDPIKKERVMEDLMNIAKVVLLVLLIVSFLVIGIFTWNASAQLLSNTQSLIDQIKQIAPAEDATRVTDAIKLQKEVYESVVKEVMSPLLSTLAGCFIAYVAGKTVGTVSYNLTEAKKSSPTPKTFSLL